MHNFVIASALFLCAVMVRSGALPVLSERTDGILAAVTDHSLLDEQLGKLSFVSTLFPEAVLVFGESYSMDTVIPVSAGTVTHAWSEDEPFTGWQSKVKDIISAAAGEVTGIYHGYEDEWIVEVSGDADYTWLYGNLEQVMVHLGDYVDMGTTIGSMLNGQEFVLEVRRDGKSVDPQSILAK